MAGTENWIIFVAAFCRCSVLYLIGLHWFYQFSLDLQSQFEGDTILREDTFEAFRCRSFKNINHIILGDLYQEHTKLSWNGFRFTMFNHSSADPGPQLGLQMSLLFSEFFLIVELLKMLNTSALVSQLADKISKKSCFRSSVKEVRQS